MDIAQLQTVVGEVADVVAVDTLGRLPAGLILAGVAVLLVLESGSPAGLLVPGSGLALTLGVLAAGGAVGIAESIGVVAVASSAGSQIAFVSARRRGGAVLPRRVEQALPDRVTTWRHRFAAQYATRPWIAAAGGQLIGAVRTLSPRLLSASTLRRREFAAASLAGATVWSCALVTVGAVGGANDTFRTCYAFAWVPVVVAVLVAQGRKRLRQGNPAGRVATPRPRPVPSSRAAAIRWPGTPGRSRTRWW